MVMRTVSFILLFIISTLTVQPLVAATCIFTNEKNCCVKKDKSCCAKKDKKSCKSEKEKGNCCGSGVCCICTCCLTATVEKENFSFARNSESTGSANLKNQNSLSGFLSKCFQPPEIV